MYYNEELKREQSTAEVVCGVVLAVAVFAAAWHLLEWATE